MSAVVGLFLQVLPLALAAGMSPTFLAMQVVVLTSPAPGALRRGWALALGSMSMLLLITFGGVSLLSALPEPHLNGSSWVQVGLFALGGVALLGVAVVMHSRPPGHRDGVLDKLVDAEPPFIFGAGALRLAVNASTLALYIPALHVISTSGANIVAKGLAFVMLFLITELAVLGPVVAVTIAGDRAKPVLTRIHEAFEQRSRSITVGSCVLVAVLLLGVALWQAVGLL